MYSPSVPLVVHRFAAVKFGAELIIYTASFSVIILLYNKISSLSPLSGVGQADVIQLARSV
jgi:hypothetical protein